MYYFADCFGHIVRDVVFVIETSYFTGYSRFQLVRGMIENITVNLKVNSPKTLFGLISFYNFALFGFNISKYTDLSTLLPAINPGLPYNRGYYGSTASALNLLLSEGMDGGFLQLRNNTSNVAIVITDGYSSSYSSLYSAAISLHVANIYDVYVIGIGSNTYSELQLIASDPSFVFFTSYLNSFTAEQLVEDVVEQLCSSELNDHLVQFQIFVCLQNGKICCQT